MLLCLTGSILPASAQRQIMEDVGDFIREILDMKEDKKVVGDNVEIFRRKSQDNHLEACESQAVVKGNLGATFQTSRYLTSLKFSSDATPNQFASTVVALLLTQLKLKLGSDKQIVFGERFDVSCIGIPYTTSWTFQCNEQNEIVGKYYYGPF